MTTTEQRTRWHIEGRGYEFCNCNPGCTCNFSGFPSSSDGSCKAMVGNDIVEGSCGDVDLSGVKAIAVIDWPHAIHDGNGKAVFIVAPETTDEQIECLSQIYTGQLGGDPWAILGTTYEVVGLVKAPISFDGTGVKATMTAEGVGHATGDSLKNPVTGEPHQAQIVLPDGFIWTKGECGVGTFQVEAEGVRLDYTDTNWIYYEFDWSND
jgi:hypothetical protein